MQYDADKIILGGRMFGNFKPRGFATQGGALDNEKFWTAPALWRFCAGDGMANGQKLDITTRSTPRGKAVEDYRTPKRFASGVSEPFALGRLICFIVAAIFCSTSAAVNENHSRLHVLTSFLPVYCFTASVAGDAAIVENLIPGTVEPHDYQLAPGDFRKLSAANLLVVNGLGLERWLGKAFRTVDAPPPVVEMSAGLNAELIYDFADGIPNPHIWLDPRMAQRCVNQILLALQKADPAHADEFAHNAAHYKERLEGLENEMEQALTPVRRRAFVTYHNAFPYLIRRFGLELTGVVEETPEISPAPRYLAGLLGKMRHDHARALFAERQSSERLAAQIASDMKVHYGELDTLETGPLNPISYEAGMRRNLAALLAGLR